MQNKLVTLAKTGKVSGVLLGIGSLSTMFALRAKGMNISDLACSFCGWWSNHAGKQSISWYITKTRTGA